MVVCHGSFPRCWSLDAARDLCSTPGGDRRRNGRGVDIVKHLEYAEASRSTLKQVFLVHGEPAATNVLMEKLAERRIGPVLYPDWGQEVEL